MILTDVVVEMIQEEITLQLHMKINDLFEEEDMQHIDKVLSLSRRRFVTLTHVVVPGGVSGSVTFTALLL